VNLGILDWGIGGLDLYRRLRATGSPRNVIYWSDAGAPPYGTLAPDVLTERVGAVVEQLGIMGCAQVLVACNAASTIIDDPGLRRRAARHGCTVSGVIVPTVRAIMRQGIDEVALIGGQRTIESRAYAEPLEDAGCRVEARVAQPLSALVEYGLTEGPEIERCLAEILGPLRDHENLVLACTHYAAALPAIRRKMPRLRTVFDPAAETLAWAERSLGMGTGESRARFVTTGSPAAMRHGAADAFGVRLPHVDAVDLPEL